MVLSHIEINVFHKTAMVTFFEAHESRGHQPAATTGKNHKDDDKETGWFFFFFFGQYAAGSTRALSAFHSSS